MSGLAVEDEAGCREANYPVLFTTEELLIESILLFIYKEYSVPSSSTLLFRFTLLSNTSKLM